MRFTQTARLMAIAVLLLVATAIVWWGVGFRLGALLLDNASAWRTFGYGPLALVRLFALAIIVPITIAVVTTASPQARWIALAAVAVGAVLIYGDRNRSDVVGVVLFVLAAAAVSEAGGTQQIATALITAVVVSFAFLADLPLPTAQKALAILVRALFFYTPLLLGPTYVERYALKRVAK
jgi:hypothetical protein